MKNSILYDFKDNVITQFIAVITFGFGVTAFYSATQFYVTTGTFQLTIKSLIFIILSFFGYFISFYILKDKKSIKIKLLKSLDFIVTILGFVLMFVPLIILCDKMFESNISFQYFLIKNCIISLVVSSIIFFIKSIFKFFIIRK